MLYQDNPFKILGVSPDDNRKRIMAAAEEKALLDDSEKIREASTTLTNPQRRIAAEVRWFPDRDDPDIEAIQEYIDDTLAGEPAVDLPLEKYSSLTQVLIKLACIDAQNFSSAAKARNYILSMGRLLGSIRPASVLAFVNGHRDNSGFPYVQNVSEIETVIGELRVEIRQQLTQKLQQLGEGSYTRVITRLAESYAENERYKGNAVLEDQISDYQLYISDTFNEKTEQLAKTADYISHNLKKIDVGEAVDDLIEDLQDWDRLAQPLQLVEMTRGSVHKASESMLLKLRNLAIKLHNDGGLTEQSLQLTNALQEVFKELPKYEELLEEDAETLTGMMKSSDADEKFGDRLTRLTDTIDEIDEADDSRIPRLIDEGLALIQELYSELKDDPDIDADVKDSVGFAGQGLVMGLVERGYDIDKISNVVNKLKAIFRGNLKVMEVYNQDSREIASIKKKRADTEAIAIQIGEINGQIKKVFETLSSQLETKIRTLLAAVKKTDTALRNIENDSSVPQARSNLAHMVRSLAIDLHNKRHESKAALQVIRGLLDEFGDLPEVCNQLREDMRILNQEVEAKASKKTKSIVKGIIIVAAVVLGISWLSRQGGSSSSSKPGSTPTMRVTSTPTPQRNAGLEPVSTYNGKVFKYPDYERVCPFEVVAGSGSDYYIYLEYVRAPSNSLESREVLNGAQTPREDDMAFYVMAGQTVEIDVPIGVYKLYYATGDTFYGTKHLFGEGTSRQVSDTLMDFYADSQYYQGHTVTLYKVANGNMSSEYVSAAEFPTD